MKPRSALVKLAAVASSLLLVGGFISYRAGAFDALLKPSPQPAEPESTPVSDPTIMYSSKSGTIVTPGTIKQSKEATLLPGSKSISIGPVIRVDAPKKPAEPSSSTTTPAPR